MEETYKHLKIIHCFKKNNSLVKPCNSYSFYPLFIYTISVFEFLQLETPKQPNIPENTIFTHYMAVVRKFLIYCSSISSLQYPFLESRL